MRLRGTGQQRVRDHQAAEPWRLLVITAGADSVADTGHRGDQPGDPVAGRAGDVAVSRDVGGDRFEAEPSRTASVR
jgi:hypothetical protein